ncbi:MULTISPECIES: AbiU2 domain-containing protein [unclassified Vibrio]|nr:hypothetical protein [Vibrio sp. V15_P4S5T153]
MAVLVQIGICDYGCYFEFSVLRCQPLNRALHALGEKMEAVEKLKSLLIDVSTDMKFYEQIFGVKENIQTLVEFSNWVFSNYQSALVNSIMMKVSRLMDPVASCGEDNLSFKNVVERCDLSNDEQILPLLAELDQVYKTTGLKNYRNKVLSHNDAKSLLTNKSTKVNLNQVELSELIKDMWHLLAVIEHRSGLENSVPEYSTEHLIPASEDGEWFIEKLRRRM